jgi:beta-lactamase regulating signal transducer with metallopeptidase domain
MNAMTNPFVVASAKGAAWLLVWSWQAAVLLACVWVGLKICRVKSPALRHNVWLLALVAVAAMPALSGVAQSLPLPQPKNTALTYAVELPRIVVTNDAAPIVQAPAPTASVKRSITKPIILSLSFAVWIWGACAFVVKAAINGLRLRRLRAGARRVSLADLDCDECGCEALRSGKASLAVSDEVRSPVLLGVLRPTIVFPADVAIWTSPMERSAMLRHELAHVERRDHYVNLFQTVLGAVFFFHPLARYACRQITMEREMACDDHVVGSGAEAESYAESIIKAAERSIGAPRGAHQIALFSARHILERRIEMILNKDRMRVFAHQWRYLVLFGAMIVAVSVVLISSRHGKIAAQPAINNDDEQILINMVREVVEGIPRRVNLGKTSPNPNLKIEDFISATGEPMWRTLDGFAPRNLTITKAVADDFVVNINGDEATVEFNGTIISKGPNSIEHKWASERYTVGMEKVNGQWRGRPLPPPPPPEPQAPGGIPGGVLGGIVDEPPPPPPPPSELMTVTAGQDLKPFAGRMGGTYNLLREAAAASIRRDTDFYERVLDENYKEIGPTGEIMNKEQAIADVKRMDYTIKKFEFDDLRVSGNEYSSFATFLATVYFETNGQDTTAQYRYTVNFIKRGGELKIAAIHLTQKH